MPSYDYLCTACQNRFSGIRKVDDRLNIECSQCNSSENVRIEITKATPFNYDNRMGAHKMTDSFVDRLKEMEKNVGRDNTLSQVIPN